MERAGWIAIERSSPRRAKRIAITTKGREAYARLTDGPAPEPQPAAKPAADGQGGRGAPVTPIRRGHTALPPGGITEPAGGWK